MIPMMKVASQWAAGIGLGSTSPKPTPTGNLLVDLGQHQAVQTQAAIARQQLDLMQARAAHWNQQIAPPAPAPLAAATAPAKWLTIGAAALAGLALLVAAARRR